MTLAFYNQVGGDRTAYYISVRLHQNGFPFTGRAILVADIKLPKNSYSLRFSRALADKERL